MVNKGLTVRAIAMTHCKRSGMYKKDEYWSISKVFSYGDMLYMIYRDKEKAYKIAAKLCQEYDVNLHERTNFV